MLIASLAPTRADVEAAVVAKADQYLVLRLSQLRLRVLNETEEEKLANILFVHSYKICKISPQTVFQ
jgi:hypothetical protein